MRLRAACGSLFGGSARLAGAAPGLQNRCKASYDVLGGFDSHALPQSGSSWEFRTLGGTPIGAHLGNQRLALVFASVSIPLRFRCARFRGAVFRVWGGSRWGLAR